MRGKSHIALGNYLIDHYLPHIPKRHARAFLIGCVEPDKNPLTYLKGSLRNQWLRGHNYRNARRYIRRISQRLEKRSSWNFLDYYTLGKLIHYTADAFTYAHNESFPTALSNHIQYEMALQEYFISYIAKNPQVDVPLAGSIMEALSSFHRKYSVKSSNIHRDSRYALRACCSILIILLTQKLI